MENKHIHFIGICGVAMSALAIAFQKKGWRVTGSDAGFFPPISTHLEKNKIDFYPGWHPEKIGKPDLVVVGNVASSTNPEWLYVQKNNIPYKSYPEAIAKYFVKENSIVCAGTYGKTSTSSLLSFIFLESGLDPSYMFGGLSQNNIDAAYIGNSHWSILEGDEYKSSRWDNSAKFTHYQPTHLLLTSVIWDHADVYPTEKSYFEAFEKLAKSIPNNGTIVACADDKKVNEIIASSTCNIIKYGKDTKNDYYYSDIQLNKNGLSFTISNKDNKYKIETNILGDYQVANITACFAMAQIAGIKTDTIIKSIKSFKGIKRRLEKRYENDIAIIDDIAHSPQKAMSVLKTLKSIYHGQIIAIFEPNTGNRKPASFSGYADAFENADQIIIPRLSKIKIDQNDTETPANGKKLAEIIGQTHHNVKYIENDKELIQYLINNTKKDDCVVFLGSRGFRGMIEQLITCLRQ
ncbi:MAG: hypothetical protein A2725_03670 [Candidatus Magasanikbacteria bacterium RIFCSPHIGHO2_01_FULL_33_34]|uniref:UDP-N-acetylmuramate:L-alanyl-gamma-D-glutamyl-meso-diaminopimelate ligase n=1 Tax=Candidatus Magasanikbacteria bacterium RIFCSPHIGHO2_01_FULL_33_34 TaxID=1798671 RepID=A0A1F6LHC0_9BACT|nr:MAG: hypothetical protein A2725_03670 [Candidatus Magasanikbacteria bacterium RIFCSPHIGHO2_01_FULL_33_34]OGH65070.1 MAG: hypothetical protein A3B83_03430 [Candidatus Magasanikbacteria bacterium RIFCSPHIGHO2_02_FULL_33_17]OGH75386.1 MAG: hypothetical protein A3A89_04735 [Candidatus Magasanikbacteria bacterium RIFCSPLOWO2_01_FULL_33_34]OGH81445.1 MAG: hypothetical protein A3F93_02525 [Candidatus Magasanikbacteria bacterium RIFCSPLOWO2_12_FULL_34_7]